MKRAKLILALFFLLNIFGCIIATIEGEKNKREHYAVLSAIDNWNNNR